MSIKVKLSCSDNYPGTFKLWNKEHPEMISKIFELAGNAARTTYEGPGKPEALKGNYKVIGVEA